MDLSIKARIRRGERTDSNQQFLYTFHTMHFSTVFTLALPAVSLATTIPRDGGNCNTGPIQCCNQVQQVRDLSTISLPTGDHRISMTLIIPQASNVSPDLLGGLVGLGLGPITGLVGCKF